MLRPVSSETVLPATTIRSVRRGSGMNGFIVSTLIRPGSDDPWPWYLPVSAQLDNGDHAVKPRFSALAIVINSRSTVRSIRLYSICNPMKDDPCAFWQAPTLCRLISDQSGSTNLARPAMVTDSPISATGFVDLAFSCAC